MGIGGDRGRSVPKRHRLGSDSTELGSMCKTYPDPELARPLQYSIGMGNTTDTDRYLRTKTMNAKLIAMLAKDLAKTAATDTERLTLTLVKDIAESY